MSLQEALSRNLKDILAKKGKKQAWLAAETGIKAQNISAYIRRKTLPDLSTICLIADKLNVSVDWLIGRQTATPESQNRIMEVREYAESIVRISDTFNATVRKADQPGGDNPFSSVISVIVDFSDRSIQASKYNKECFEFVEFMDAWCSYRDLYIAGKIEKCDYELLTQNRLNKINVKDIPAGALLNDYIKAHRLPWM